ncbi:porin family protein [Sulfurovum sp. NBC37-1]|uniref:porin family protein n=1 Tax=Sulfurovum sp. (strain NBC37-1) TaxID=387093 RepID=UPI0001587A7D|nr:porin family protein [Sulfurovum sp. NBC37-1]BAF73321.1 hypothetical protein SUN_2385 [Sulfurovum sp. NBC37-1]
MQKLLKVTMTSLVLLTMTYAEEMNENNMIEVETESESPFYIVTKGMVTPGGDMREEEALLEGDNAYGVGLDIGYMFHEHFGIEFSTVYGKNDITRTEEMHGEIEVDKAKATYVSYAINLIFKHPINEEFGYFIKAGYEKEHETIDDFNIDEKEHGVDAAAGLTYEINEKMAALVEYEYSSIRGLRGDAFFLGIEFEF